MQDIDVIIPTFNRVELTLRAVRSVQQQSATNWRCIVVDDASTPEVADNLEEALRGDGRVEFVRLRQNIGPMPARQLMLDTRCSASWVTTLDSDDEILPSKLERQLALATEGHDVVICGHRWIRPDGSVRVERIPSTDGPRRPLATNNINAPLVSRRLLDSVGGFTSRAGSPLSCGHIEWCTRILGRSPSVAAVEEVLVACHDHDADRTSDLFGTSNAAAELRAVAETLEEELPEWPAAVAALWASVSWRYLDAQQSGEALRALAHAHRVNAPTAARELLRRSKFVASRLVLDPVLRRSARRADG